MIQRRKSVFLTLWLSYIAILIIPVSVAAVLYTNMERTMVDNANRSNLAMLEQVRQVMDNHLLEIDRLIVQISTHPKLQTLWSIRDSDRYIQYDEAVKALKNIRVGNGFIDDFYIHLRDSDIIVSPSFKTDAETFYTWISPYANRSLHTIRGSLLSGYHFKTFWPATPVLTSASTSKNVIASAVSLPLGESYNVWGTLVMLIEEQQFFDLLKQIQWVNNGVMYIMDSTGQVITSTDRTYKLPDGLRNAIAGTSGYESYKGDGGKSMLSYTTGQAGWKYVSLVPQKVVLKRVNEIENIALLLLGLVVVVGTVAAYWMAYRSYSPIRDMVYALMGRESSEKKKPLAHLAVNEYEFIKTSIAQTVAEGKELKEKLEGHIPVVRAYFLSRLLKGQAEPASLDERTLQFMGVRFIYDYISVVLIEVDDSSQFRIEDSERDWALVRFILFNLSTELIGDRGFVTETDKNRIAILLNVQNATEQVKRERDDLISELKRLIEERFRMKISIATSSIRQGIAEAGRCYGEALNALDYRIIHGISSVIHFENIRVMERAYYHYPLETETQLMNHVKSGDFDHAVRLLDELYEQNVVSNNMTPEMGKCLFFDLLSTLLKVINALKIDEKRLFLGSSDPVKHIVDSPSAEVMLQKIKSLCQFICENVREARTDLSGHLIERLRRHIEESYGDNALSLTSIAEHFGMTPQYVSGFFKKQSGGNITDYIVDVRMKEAKRLLADPGLTVFQVAQSVGYATDIGFIRVFKKVEGITPGKYREMLLQTGEMKNG